MDTATPASPIVSTHVSMPRRDRSLGGRPPSLWSNGPNSRWAIEECPLLASGNLLSCQLGDKCVGISSRPLRHLAGSRLVFLVYLLLACEETLHRQSRKNLASRSFIHRRTSFVSTLNLLSLRRP